MLEICQNAAGSTDLATDHRGHDGSSRTPSSHTCAISSVALFITLDSKCDGSSHAQRPIEGLRCKILELLEYGYWDYFSKLHDEPAGRTVRSSLTPHLVRLPHHPSAAALCWHLRTIISMTDLHKLRMWYLCISSLKNLHIHLWTDFL